MKRKRKRKPRLTYTVLEGIIEATSVLLSGDVASAFGYDNPETRKQWDKLVRADSWARQMRQWHDSRRCPECDLYPCTCMKNWKDERRLSGV